MQITWHGKSCFSIKSKSLNGEESVVIINPFNEQTSGLKISKTNADIVLLGNKDEKIDLKKMADNFLLIDTPGEFEAKNIFINGLADNNTSTDKKKQGHIIFFLEVEGIKILNLGDLNHSLESGYFDKISDVDILMLPVGGGETINAEKAIEIINQIEPRIIIPMNYKIPGLKETSEGVEKFAGEMGADPKKILDKLKIEKKNLPQEISEVIILDKK